MDFLEKLGIFFQGYQPNKKATIANAWFTPEYIKNAAAHWAIALTYKNIKKWLSGYDLPARFSDKTILVVCAGNIPFVGLHDLICVLLAGHRLIIKCSQKDSYLLFDIVSFLKRDFPLLAERIIFTDGLVKKFDAVIATGSDNTQRYFDYYFSKYPNILRKNRNSIAVLTGRETTQDLTHLCDDIFEYFGLGCRSVSKIFVPIGYDFNPLFKASLKYQHLINHPKYKNNYDYQKSIYLLNETPVLTNELFLLAPLENYQTPIAVLGYEYYDRLDSVIDRIKNDSKKIQCIVTAEKIKQGIPFGKAQQPALWDYADGIDTLKFLTTL